MTVKQGEDINKQFISLNDSISVLNGYLGRTKNELLFTEARGVRLDSTLKMTSNSLLISEEEIKRLNSLVKRNESRYWQEKRTWAGWMLFSVVVTVVVGIFK